ncbi:MAG: riboflavin synthase [Gammaproteobacteria bacterium]|nr:riboflavin synthase [Gammaproteobacteria bacterium]
MFTGIIEQQAKVLENQIHLMGRRLVLETPYPEIVLGESIAVDGVCLTAIAQSAYQASFDVSPETIAKTNLSLLKEGDLVHLEKAALAQTRMGGHYVSGHVDAIIAVSALEKLDDYVKICVGDFSEKEMLFLVEKGSITLNGVSLTINALHGRQIELMLVPHTLKATNFDKLSIGQQLNVEFDYLTRIIAHQLEVMRNLNDKRD